MNAITARLYGFLAGGSFVAGIWAAARVAPSPAAVGNFFIGGLLAAALLRLSFKDDVV